MVRDNLDPGSFGQCFGNLNLVFKQHDQNVRSCIRSTSHKKFKRLAMFPPEVPREVFHSLIGQMPSPQHADVGIQHHPGVGMPAAFFTDAFEHVRHRL